MYAPPDGMASHRWRASGCCSDRPRLTPVEGKRKVFILGDADRLVPQESSPDAANALLKLLEEPPVRIAVRAHDGRCAEPPADHSVARRSVLAWPAGRRRGREFLPGGGAPSRAPCEILRRTAGGSMGRGPGLGLTRSRHGASTPRASCSRRCWRAGRACRPGWSGRSGRPPGPPAESSPPCSTRLADTLGDAARAPWASSRRRRPVPDSLRSHRDPAALLRAIDRVAEAREAAAGNVNPQLLLAMLGEELAEVL